MKLKQGTKIIIPTCKDCKSQDIEILQIKESDMSPPGVPKAIRRLTIEYKCNNCNYRGRLNYTNAEIIEP